MTAARTALGCDPWQMALIHRILRRGFEQSGDAVRSRPDAERASAVAEYVQFNLDGLHGHHTSEDENLWPRLHERAAMAHDLVERMEQQHEGLDTSIDRTKRNLVIWSRRPTAEAATELADALDAVLAGLVEHLGEEEEQVVPFIGAHITEAEWEAGGKAAFAKFKPNQRFTALGEMLRAATPDEARRMLAELPLPVRLVWRLVGHPKYERLMARVLG
jgi:hemerythrin-like domain-containing protein